MAKFGWCLTNYHPQCMGTISNYICSCECHQAQASEPTTTKEEEDK